MMRIYRISGTFEAGIPGHCFKNVIKWVTSNDSNNCMIIHGKVTNIENKRIEHAWIERAGEVIDPTSGIIIDKQKYYQLLSPEIDAIYTPEQLLINSIRSRHGGPWTKEEFGDRIIWERQKSENI